MARLGWRWIERDGGKFGQANHGIKSPFKPARHHSSDPRYLTTSPHFAIVCNRLAGKGVAAGGSRPRLSLMITDRSAILPCYVLSPSLFL